MNHKGLWAIIVVIILIGLGVYMYSEYYHKPVASQTVSSGAEEAVTANVVAFGSKLQMVSLLAPDAAAQIRAQYEVYVGPDLLAQWVADPSKAPGRTVSSPWPQKIDVVSVKQLPDSSYAVEGNVIEVISVATSTEAAGVYPVSLRVQSKDGQWLITSYEKGAYSQLPQKTTITGKWECLPPKNAGGVHTLECAFGIAKDKSDGHYAVDTSLLSSSPIDYPTGTHVKVEGVLVTSDQLNSVQKYDIDGIIRITSIQKL